MHQECRFSLLGLYFKHCLIFIAGNGLKFDTVEMLKTKSEQELGWFRDTESACSAWPAPAAQPFALENVLAFLSTNRSL